MPLKLWWRTSIKVLIITLKVPHLLLRMHCLNRWWNAPLVMNSVASYLIIKITTLWIKRTRSTGLHLATKGRLLNAWCTWNSWLAASIRAYVSNCAHSRTNIVAIRIIFLHGYCSSSICSYSLSTFCWLCESRSYWIFSLFLLYVFVELIWLYVPISFRYRSWLIELLWIALWCVCSCSLRVTLGRICWFLRRCKLRLSRFFDDLCLTPIRRLKNLFLFCCWLRYCFLHNLILNDSIFSNFIWIIHAII